MTRDVCECCWTIFLDPRAQGNVNQLRERVAMDDMCQDSIRTMVDCPPPRQAGWLRFSCLWRCCLKRRQCLLTAQGRPRPSRPQNLTFCPRSRVIAWILFVGKKKQIAWYSNQRCQIDVEGLLDGLPATRESQSRVLLCARATFLIDGQDYVIFSISSTGSLQWCCLDKTNAVVLRLPNLDDSCATKSISSDLSQ